MIPVRGFEGAQVAVLGLGRSGLTAARALNEGGARALCWDDSPEARAKAEAEGLALRDLTREGAWEGVAALIV
jgi:UDP-N-acetylmuramoylalanine--D-glutamate ligase